MAENGFGSPTPTNLADISYLKENFKLHLLGDGCTLYAGALVSDSLLHTTISNLENKRLSYRKKALNCLII